MTESERMPFSGDYEPKAPKKGVKLVNKAPPAGHDAAGFEERVQEFIADKQDRNKNALTLAQQFMSLLRDRTLHQNKSVMAKEVEHQVVADLASSALAINQDDSEPEGMGSIVLINLLFKSALAQRDKINELEYELAKLKKQLSSQERAPATNDK